MCVNPSFPHVFSFPSQVWKPGDLCVVQHTPLGPSRAAAADSQWQLAEPGALIGRFFALIVK